MSLVNCTCVVQTNVYGVFKKKGMWIQGIILLHVFIVGKFRFSI